MVVFEAVVGCVVGAVLVDVCLRIGVWLRCARRLAWRENRVVAFFCLSSNGMHQSFPISLALVSHKVCDRLSPALDCLPNGKVANVEYRESVFFGNIWLRAIPKTQTVHLWCPFRCGESACRGTILHHYVYGHTYQVYVLCGDVVRPRICCRGK